jgi:hypothetical protein
MKNAIIISLLFLGFNLVGCSQKNVPENVKKEFAKKFLSAKSIEWGSEEANEWEAEFKMDGKKMSACFDSLGAWIVTETEISEKELPEALANSLKTDFAGYKKNLIEIYEDTKVKGYELVLIKGKTSFEVIFDNTGKVFKKTEVKEENEKEEK